MVEEETCRRKAGELVPTPRLPRKYDLAVVLEIKLLTVKLLEVVATSDVPRESETMMEFKGKTVELVPPLATGRVPVTWPVRETWPGRFECERHVPEMA